MAIVKSEVKSMVQGQLNDQTLEKILTEGDLGTLNSKDVSKYIINLCQSLELNHLTKPFQLINFQGKKILYATKDCTEQLRKRHNVSLNIVEKRFEEGIYIVTARATLPNGRSDESTGALPLPESLKGDARANAIMKAETKAKRRVTLSICGLGMLDESELDTMPKAQIVKIAQHSSEESIQQTLLEEIYLSQDLNELKENYVKAYKYASEVDDEELKEKIIAAKDKRKEILEPKPSVVSSSKDIDSSWEEFKKETE